MISLNRSQIDMVEKNLLTIRISEGIEKSEGCSLCYLRLKNEESHMDFLLTNEAIMSSEVRREILDANLSRYLGYPEGRVFSRYQQKEKREFLDMAKKFAIFEQISKQSLWMSMTCQRRLKAG